MNLSDATRQRINRYEERIQHLELENQEKVNQINFLQGRVNELRL